ncbi:MAG: ligand-binding sensor domain-containing protein [Anaerolineae bacterium]
MKIRAALAPLVLVALFSPLPALADPDLKTAVPDGESEPLWQSLSNANWVSGVATEGDLVWAATGGGVVRWDTVGNSFTKFTTADGLLDNVVYCVAVDHEGHKWFGTSYGVSYFDDAIWHSYTQATTADGETVSLDHVQAIAVDEAGAKWMGFAWGVACFDDARWRVWTEGTGLPHNGITGIAIDGDRKWFSTRGGGVLEFSGDRWTQHMTAGGVASNQVEAIAAAGGRVWCSTWAGLSVFDGKAWAAYSDEEDEGVVPEAAVGPVATDSRGRLWVGCDDGVAVLGEEGWQRYTAADGLPSGEVSAIAFDEAGYAWLGFSGYGLVQDSRRGWVRHSLDEPLPRNEVLAVTVDRGGTAWLGTIAGLFRADGDGWTSRLAGEPVVAIAEGPGGTMWFGTLGHGAYSLSGEVWTTYTRESGLADDSVYAFAFDGAGNTWMGTQSGLSRLAPDGSLTTFDQGSTGPAGLGSNRIRALFVDQAGAVWVGTAGGGVSRFDGDKWVTYTQTSTRGGLAYDWVYCITEDEKGTIWFGTGGGLSSLSEGEWTRHERRSKLGGLSIRAFATDCLGRLWLAMDGGIACFDGGRWLGYTSMSGLASNAVNAVAIDAQQRLWLGTDGGLTRVSALPQCPEPAGEVEVAIP